MPICRLAASSTTIWPAAFAGKTVKYHTNEIPPQKPENIRKKAHKPPVQQNGFRLPATRREKPAGITIPDRKKPIPGRQPAVCKRPGQKWTETPTWKTGEKIREPCGPVSRKTTKTGDILRNGMAATCRFIPHSGRKILPGPDTNILSGNVTGKRKTTGISRIGIPRYPPATCRKHPTGANGMRIPSRPANVWHRNSRQSPAANMHSLTHAPTGPHAGPASPHSPSGKHPALFRDILDRKTLPEKAAGRNGHPRQKTDTP